MILHTYTPKRKPRKPNAKVRELRASWSELLRKYDVKPRENNARASNGIRKGSTDLYPIPIGRQSSRHIGSIDNGIGSVTKKASPVYTGDAMIGIVVQHKSCLQPVFSKEAAQDSAKMRR